MGFFKPDPPEPPNPLTTASASTSTNVNTAVANAYLNNMNQSTPQGSLNYDQTGSYQWTDPVTGSSYTIPRFTSTQSLTPVGQATLDTQNRTGYNLASMGEQQSLKVGNLLNTPFNPGQYAPSAGNAQNIGGLPAAATNYGQAPPIQSGIGNTGDIATTYGGADNYSADRDKVQEALMQRINPQLDIQRKQLEQQLADQGIRYGSAAYNNAFTPYNQQANDARFSAISQAGQEQQRMNAMAAQAAAFQNAGQQQGYEQQLGQGAFYNQAQNQQFQQNAAAGSFYNSGLAQQLAQQQAAFNASQAARNQYMQEAYQQRNQPLNEINALQSGSQLQNPNWLNTPQSQIPTTDMAGLINQNFNQQMGIFNQQSTAANQLIGGALGLGAGALKLSDERQKENIHQIGTIFAAPADDTRMGSVITDRKDDAPQMASVIGDAPAGNLPVYEYSYKKDPASTRHIGPMAQDVEKIDPKAVRNIKGTKYIDQRRLMGGILRAS